MLRLRVPVRQFVHREQILRQLLAGVCHLHFLTKKPPWFPEDSRILCREPAGKGWTNHKSRVKLGFDNLRKSPPTSDSKSTAETQSLTEPHVSQAKGGTRTASQKTTSIGHIYSKVAKAGSTVHAKDEAKKSCLGLKDIAP